MAKGAGVRAAFGLDELVTKAQVVPAFGGLANVIRAENGEGAESSVNESDIEGESLGEAEDVAVAEIESAVAEKARTESFGRVVEIA